MKILLTNDDSHRSPLLAMVAKFLRTMGELSIVVPLHEQSWRGKSMSRFNPVQVKELDVAGQRSWAVDGTPADCVSIAINHLIERPDIVISGINAGLNTGTSFVYCSGTVGACIEASIAGLPSIALSQEFDSPTHNRYLAEYALEYQILERLEHQFDAVAKQVVAPLMSNQRVSPQQDVVWNINLPFILAEPMSYEITSLEKMRYGSPFVKAPEGFRHELTEVFHDTATDTDAAALRRGHVSITPVRPHLLGALSEDERQGYAKLFQR